MYNLLVAGFSRWDEKESLFSCDRVFEHTTPQLVEYFKPNNNLNFDLIRKLPCLFLTENTTGDSDVRESFLADIVDIKQSSPREYKLLYARRFQLEYDDILKLKDTLDIANFEFHRNHWAIKDIDLYRVLYEKITLLPFTSQVFKLDKLKTNSRVVSVMMPFDKSYDAVYQTLKMHVEDLGKAFKRADDIWNNDVIIQDIVDLIASSQVVICDLTGKNPNVFYEAGISHSIGKNVILITQSDYDVPFNLRHLRYIKYLNNAEGLEKLGQDLRSKLESIFST